jgi:hypothetical protein
MLETLYTIGRLRNNDGGVLCPKEIFSNLLKLGIRYGSKTRIGLKEYTKNSKIPRPKIQK